MDDIFMNIDKCEDYHMIWNKYNWCLNHVGQCYYADGMIDRILDRGLTEMINPAIELFNIYWSHMFDDHRCDTDETSLDTIDRAIKAKMSLWSSLVGFDAEWTNFEEVEHITFKDMHHNIHQKIKEDGRGCPVKYIFNEMFPPMPELPEPTGGEHHRKPMFFNPFFFGGPGPVMMDGQEKHHSMFGSLW